MTRIPTIDKKELLPPEHQALYDAIAKSRGRVGGPFLALLHSPEIAERTAHLGSYLAKGQRTSHPKMHRS